MQLAEIRLETEQDMDARLVEIVRTQDPAAIQSWRNDNPDKRLDLRKATLASLNLSGMNFSGADLSRADLQNTDLSHADLSNADLTQADLSAYDPPACNLSHADLKGANLECANLWRANLSHANLTGANLEGATAWHADLSHADLIGANLSRTCLVDTDLRGVKLRNCRVYGASVWKANLEGAEQTNLIIDPFGGPIITIENLELAQFIYLLMENERIRHAIDTMTLKVVLLLGRFSKERKEVLDAIREQLRRMDRVPVLFDFEKPASKDLTGTVETLAGMARFIIADITDPSSVPHELASIVPRLRKTPVLPLRLAGTRSYSVFEDLSVYPWVIKTYEYQDSPSLISGLEAVISPADRMADQLRTPS